MPLDQTINFDVVQTLEEGQYEFAVIDLNVSSSDHEDNIINYLQFTVKELESKNDHEHLLNAPINLKSFKISDTSKLGKILSKLGLDVSGKERVDAKAINTVIGKKFTAIVSHEYKAGNDTPFAKIQIDSIHIV